LFGLRSRAPSHRADPVGHAQWRAEQPAIGHTIAADSSDFTNVLIVLTLVDPSKPASLAGVDAYHHVPDGRAYVQYETIHCDFRPGPKAAVSRQSQPDGP